MILTIILSKIAMLITHNQYNKDYLLYTTSEVADKYGVNNAVY